MHGHVHLVRYLAQQGRLAHAGRRLNQHDRFGPSENSRNQIVARNVQIRNHDRPNIVGHDRRENHVC